jgi:tripartite-type tricarboxylate transporter receptor subunit TctC
MRCLAPASLCAFVLFLALGAQHAIGQGGTEAYPSRPVHLAVPYPPGGATDIIARNLAQKLQELLGQPVVFDYRAGSGGVIATEFVAKAAPDGHTMGMVTTAHVINPGLRKNLPYDTLRDFSGVSMVAVSHILIAATPSLEANNLPEVLTLARHRPGKLAFASPGVGGAMHLSGELIKYTTGVDIVHVPYKGGAAAYPDVIAGRIPLIIDPVFAVWQYVRSGKMKAIAMASPQRVPSYPDVPAVSETIPGFSVMSITGIIVPRAVPRALVNRLAADIGRALQAPDLKARMMDAGMEPSPSTPEQFDAFIRSEAEKWTKVIRQTGVTAD